MSFYNSQSKSFQKLNPHIFAPVYEDKPVKGEPLEMPLHEKIMRHCNDQWPRWLYIRARPDMASTISEGAQDFTIFLPCRVLCVECKSETGKISEKQRDWHHLMGLLGHTVYIVRSMDEFLKLI